MYYIGVDLGTSAVKLLLMEGNGKICNIVSNEYSAGASMPSAFPMLGINAINNIHKTAKSFLFIISVLLNNV